MARALVSVMHMACLPLGRESRRRRAGPSDGVPDPGKIDGDDAADGGGGLVHQAAGLVEEDVLGILADLGDLDLENFSMSLSLYSPRRMAPMQTSKAAELDRPEPRSTLLVV